MSSEGSSSTQTEKPLFFYGILYHAYYNKLPLIKAQMNMGFQDKKKIYWTENPDFNHSEQSLNETLKCIEVDAHYLMPSVIGYKGIFFPFIGYSFLNYSYTESFESTSIGTFQFHAFSIGMEYSSRITKNYTHSFYFSFSPLMLNNTGKKSYLYYNYGAEFQFETQALSLTFFSGFKNGFDRKVKELHRANYIFSNSEVGLSFTINLQPLFSR